MNVFRISLLLALSTMIASASADELNEDSGAWMQAVAEGSMEFIDPSLKKGRIWMEGQTRFDGNWDHWYQGMVRTAVGYSLSDRATLWAGYTWLPTQNIGKNYIAQQDIWPASTIATFSPLVKCRKIYPVALAVGRGADTRALPLKIRFTDRKGEIFDQIADEAGMQEIQ